MNELTVAESVRSRQGVSSAFTRETELTPESSRVLLKAHLWRCLKKLGRGQSIQHQEIVALLRYAERKDRSQRTEGIPGQLVLLRGHLTILRIRAERGIPISVDSIAKAEQLARNLESLDAFEGTA